MSENYKHPLDIPEDSEEFRDWKPKHVHAHVRKVFKVLGINLEDKGKPSCPDDVEELVKVLLFLEIEDTKVGALELSALNTMLRDEEFRTKFGTSHVPDKCLATCAYITRYRSLTCTPSEESVMEFYVRYLSSGNAMHPRFSPNRCSMKMDDKLDSFSRPEAYLNWRKKTVGKLNICGLKDVAFDETAAKAHPERDNALYGLLVNTFLDNAKLAFCLDVVPAESGYAVMKKLDDYHKQDDLVQLVLQEQFDKVHKLELLDNATADDLDRFLNSHSTHCANIRAYTKIAEQKNMQISISTVMNKKQHLLERITNVSLQAKIRDLQLSLSTITYEQLTAKLRAEFYKVNREKWWNRPQPAAGRNRKRQADDNQNQGNKRSKNNGSENGSQSRRHQVEAKLEDEEASHESTVSDEASSSASPKSKPASAKKAWKGKGRKGAKDTKKSAKQGSSEKKAKVTFSIPDEDSKPAAKPGKSKAKESNSNPSTPSPKAKKGSGKPKKDKSQSPKKGHKKNRHRADNSDEDNNNSEVALMLDELAQQFANGSSEYYAESDLEE